MKRVTWKKNIQDYKKYLSMQIFLIAPRQVLSLLNYVDEKWYINIISLNIFMFVFIKKSSYIRCSSLIELSVIDKIENKKRFLIFYILLSYYCNMRIIIKKYLLRKESLQSLRSLYLSSN